jgi:hypothetical protein
MIWLFWGGIALLLVYEAIALVNHRPGDTISELFWAASTTRPILPFAMGLLMGHFFFVK